MRILLFNTYHNFPVGLRYIASFLERDGHDVFLHQLSSPGRGEINSIMDTIKPQVVGLSCYSLGALKVMDVAKIVKEYSSKVKIVLGNIHATIFYHLILERFPFVDYCIRGEGEIPTLQLLEALESKREMEDVQNLSFRRPNGEIVTNEAGGIIDNLDELTDFPNRFMREGILHYRGYRSHKIATSFFKMDNETAIVTSRGCPYGCDFCAGRSLFGHSWRAHSPQNVVDGIERIRLVYGIRYFMIYDAIFTFDKERVKQICRLIRDRRLDIKWWFQTHANHIDPELVEEVHRAGCNSFSVGIDGTTEASVKSHKGVRLDIDQLARSIKLARGLKMIARVNQIIGLPGEGFQDVVQAAKRLRILKPSIVGCFALAMMPGTKLYHEAVEKRVISDQYWLDKKSQSFPMGIYLNKRNKSLMTLISIGQAFYMTVVSAIYSRSTRTILFIFFSAAEIVASLLRLLYRKARNCKHVISAQ